ncbi:MAG: DMT family transporter [Clostridiales bacterium]|nr:DMT family transporter [Clostridiales bacterium]
MSFLEKNPLLVMAVGVTGISMSAILVRFSQAPSLITACYRMLWTALIMLAVTFGNRTSRRELVSVSRRTLCMCGISGLFLALHLAVWFESLSQTSVASSTAIVCTEVIWVAMGYCFFLKGRISLSAAASIGVTLIGSLVIAMSDYSAGDSHLYGDALALAAAVFCAVYTLIGSEERRSLSTTIYTCIVYVSCSIFLVIAVIISGLPLTGYGWDSIAVGFLLAVCSTLLGHSIFSWCLRYFSPSFVSACRLCEPVGASVFALLLFGEKLALLQVAGGVITIAGVWLYSRFEKHA